VLEGLSQTAALLFRLSYGPEALRGAPLLGHMPSVAQGGARPGDTIEYAVRAIKMTSKTGIFSGVARVDGAMIAEAELGFGVDRS
jgi:3-hydroxymyristoyl/3-hydroxydecanoyl-(acyl carrier protein) dehydratase